MSQLRKGYQDCVYDSVASQVKTSFRILDPSAVTELAFQACLTEEQAILADANAAGDLRP